MDVWDLRAERGMDPRLIRLARSPEGVGFGARTIAALWRSGYKAPEDIVRVTDAELLRSPQFGRKSLAWIRGQMDRMGVGDWISERQPCEV